MNKYTDCNHASGPGIHIAIGNPSFLLRDRGKEWCVEWHYYGGPQRVHKRTGEVLDAPDEKSRFWLVAQWWKDQGGKVVDGVGVWVEPPIVEQRFTRINSKNLIEDPKGKVVMRFYAGYESWGQIA